MHLVFYEVLPPLPLDFGPARGAGVPLGICLSRAGSLLLLLLLREVGARELALLLQTPFSRPVGGCGAVVRDRTLSRITRVTARGQACDYLLLLPACGPWKLDGWPDVGPRRVWRRLSLSLLWPGAAAGVPPVLEGRPLPLSRLFLQELAKFFMSLSGSTWSLGGCDRFCSSVGGYRVSRFDCCWGGHFLCCDCDACWGWRFCLLLPLLVLAFLVTSSVRG